MGVIAAAHVGPGPQPASIEVGTPLVIPPGQDLRAQDDVRGSVDQVGDPSRVAGAKGAVVVHWLAGKEHVHDNRTAGIEDHRVRAVAEGVVGSREIMVVRGVVPLPSLGVVAGALVNRDLLLGWLAIHVVQGAILILERIVHVGLLDEIQELGEGRVLRDSANGPRLGPGTGKRLVGRLEVVHRQPDLLEVVCTLQSACRFPGRLDRRQVGLVGLWDVVAFDEVAGISFKDKDGVQIMKDYMASGSFARGRDAVNAYASMVFVGNINQPVDTLVKTSHLLAPFPEAMIDSAFFDRFHAYIPGWEIPKMRPEFFTNQYGLIVDYFAEWVREMRKRNFGDAINKYFKLGRDLNQRDSIAVKHTVSGLLKLLYPSEEYDKEAVRRCLEYALEVRRRVKEQLKKIGGMEFFDVHFSYIDMETSEEKFISVREQGGGSLIPEGPLNPGVTHTVATGGNDSHLGLYRLETQVTAGNGSLKMSGLGSNMKAKEAIKVGFDYFKANVGGVSASVKVGDHDYHLHIVELHNTGPTTAMTLTTFIALCSAVLGKPIQSQMVVLGSMSLGGNIIPVESLAESLQVAHDAGAKRVLLPMASVSDIPTIPGELFAKFQTSFYSDPRDAAFKALGVE